MPTSRAAVWIVVTIVSASAACGNTGGPGETETSSSTSSSSGGRTYCDSDTECAAHEVCMVSLHVCVSRHACLSDSDCGAGGVCRDFTNDGFLDCGHLSPGSSSSSGQAGTSGGTSSSAAPSSSSPVTGSPPRVDAFTSEMFLIGHPRRWNFWAYPTYLPAEVTAQVSDPDGAVNLAGGEIRDSAGRRVTLFTGSLGEYEADVEWEELPGRAAINIAHGSTQALPLQAVFLDQDNNQVTRDFTLTLVCEYDELHRVAACSGECVDLETDEESCGTCGHACYLDPGADSLTDAPFCEAFTCKGYKHSTQRASCQSICSSIGWGCELSQAGYQGRGFPRDLPCGSTPPSTDPDGDGAFTQMYCTCTSPG